MSRDHDSHRACSTSSQLVIGHDVTLYHDVQRGNLIIPASALTQEIAPFWQAFLHQLVAAPLSNEVPDNRKSSILWAPTETDIHVQNDFFQHINTKQALLIVVPDEAFPAFQQANQLHCTTWTKWPVEQLPELLLHHALLYQAQSTTTLTPLLNLPPLLLTHCYTPLTFVAEEAHRMKERDLLNRTTSTESHLVRHTQLERYEALHRVWQSPISLEKLFMTETSGESNQSTVIRRILVVGLAGMGKSTLCQYLEQRFYSGTLWQNRYRYCFRLTLGLLKTTIDILREKQKPVTLSEVIQYQCLVSEARLDLTLVAIQSALRGGDALVLADGFDQVLSYWGKDDELIGQLLRELLLHYSGDVLVTSRPIAVHQLQAQMNRTIEAIGFLDADIEGYVVRYFNRPDYRSLANGQALLDFLRSHLGVWGIAHVPFNLRLLCYLWQQHHTLLLVGPNQLTLTSLYQQTLQTFFDYHQSKWVTGQFTEFTSWSRYEQHYRAWLLILGEVASIGLTDETTVLKPQILVKTLEKYQTYIESTTLTLEALWQLNLLVPWDRTLRFKESPFYFAHLTFQEWLTAWYWLQGFLGNLQVVTAEETKIQVIKIRSQIHYSTVLKFLSGLLQEGYVEANSNEKARYDAAQQLFWDALCADQETLLQVPQYLATVCHCLEEARLQAPFASKQTILKALVQYIDHSIQELSTQEKHPKFNVDFLHSLSSIFTEPVVLNSLLSHLTTQPQVVCRLIELSRIYHPDLIDALIKLMKTGTPALQQVAGHTIGVIANAATVLDIIKKMESLLNTEKESIQQAVLCFIIRLDYSLTLPMPLLEMLLSFVLTHLDFAIKSVGLEILVTIGQLGRGLGDQSALLNKILNLLIEYLSNNDESMQVTVIHAIEQLASQTLKPVVLTCLMEKLQNNNPLLNTAIEKALMKLVPRSGISKKILSCQLYTPDVFAQLCCTLVRLYQLTVALNTMEQTNTLIIYFENQEWVVIELPNSHVSDLQTTLSQAAAAGNIKFSQNPNTPNVHLSASELHSTAETEQEKNQSLPVKSQENQQIMPEHQNNPLLEMPQSTQTLITSGNGIYLSQIESEGNSVYEIRINYNQLGTVSNALSQTLQATLIAEKQNPYFVSLNELPSGKINKLRYYSDKDGKEAAMMLMDSLRQMLQSGITADPSATLTFSSREASSSYSRFGLFQCMGIAATVAAFSVVAEVTRRYCQSP